MKLLNVSNLTRDEVRELFEGRVVLHGFEVRGGESYALFELV